MSESIALYSPDMRGGGAERVTLNLAREFSRRGIQVDLVLARASGQYLKELPEEVRVIDLDSNSVHRSIPGLVNYFRRERPLAMLSTQMHANVAALIAKRTARVTSRLVVREANIITLPRDWRMRMKVRSMLSLARLCYPWADEMIAVSSGVANALHRGIGVPRDRIAVIYNPVIRDELKEKAREQPDHAWFNELDVPIIVSAGRLEEQKDFSTLIRAFSIVRKEVYARLVIFGEGGERAKLESLIEDLALESDVALPGFTDRPYAHMARASVYVLSSAWEGLPNALIEAMSLGVRVVATDCESGPREILADGEYGFLAPVGDPEMLAQGILAALTRDDYPLSSSEAMARFHVDHAVNQYLRLLCGDQKTIPQAIEAK